MRTSALRHPKYEHAITIHSWMMKITEKNLFACTLLAYLESKFNTLLDAKEKNGGWMRLQRFQVKNGMFADSFNEMEEAIQVLESLDLILVNHISDGKGEQITSNEICIKLDALRINEWLDVYSKTNTNKMDLLEYAPFMHLLLINYKIGEVELEPEQTEQFQLTPPAEKKETKKREVKPLDENVSEKCRDLFAFWKMKTGHKRANLQDKHKRIIAARLKDGYTIGQIAHAIIGITFSKHHIEEKYDHIYYVVRETSMMEKFIGLATKEGITEDQAFQQLLELKTKLEAGGDIPYEDKKYVNPHTGKELV